MASQHNLLNGPEPAEFRQKLKIIIVVILVAFSILLVRLWYLQVIKGDELKQRSENNSIRFRKIMPLRGLVMDRNRHVIVDNRPSFDVLYMPSRGKYPDRLVEKIKELYFRRSLEFSYDQPFPRQMKPYLPVRLEKNVSMEKIALIETNSLDLPGIYVDVSPVRLYLEGETIAPIIGYTGEISKEELESGDEYASGDVIGKHGVEKYLDSYIRGSRGAELVEVNAYGKEIKNLGRIDPISGYNVVLNIDAAMQKTAWEAFEGKSGAAVALDPRSGAVLAMVSSPSFDPNLFNSGVSGEQWNKIANNPLTPLTNRAITGQYPPGSTYKLIVAAAALEEGIVTPETKFVCDGTYQFGNRTFRCWQKKGHGTVSLHKAMVESCDVYFYNVGRMLGVDKIAHYAKLFGLGGITGIDLPNEKSGLIPTKQWKLAKRREAWQPGETISISIGQGFDLVTPLQLVSAFSAFANGGMLWQPQLVKSIETVEGKVHKEFLPEKKGDLPLKKETIDLLSRALWGVVNEPTGTGKVARRPNADVCGKTGTSQVVGLPENDKSRRMKKIGILQRDHALFVCYAPLKNPEIAVAVVVENAGHGGAVAAPVARKILDAYFDGKKKIKQEKVAMASEPSEKVHQ
ncbi:MAG: penicillin-binding protein 2 [Deltaproteobacteria bacterium HGW-Deltaproteobacteria-10]|nr:MAG: penicillin-binding protein 2 [Deltaproteobacteria bacterium HGW-Deltaproteobacteria-10]